jgi:hypothetical protein
MLLYILRRPFEPDSIQQFMLLNPYTLSRLLRMHALQFTFLRTYQLRVARAFAATRPAPRKA